MVESERYCFSHRIYVAMMINNRWECLYTEEVKRWVCGEKVTFKPIPFERFSIPAVAIVDEGQREGDQLITTSKYI